VAADLQPRCRYDEVVRSRRLRSSPVWTASRCLHRPSAGVPYLVNVITDPAIAYPRSTTGI
jgi:acetolactate synthase-1/2/3 large subunit